MQISELILLLIQLTSQAKKKAGEAGKSVQASLTKTALDDRVSHELVL